MNKRGRKATQHPAGCTCEKCYRAFCELNGLKYEHKPYGEKEQL